MEPLIESGIQMVQACARRTKRLFYSADFEDLIAAGLEALVFCAARFDDNGVTRFTSYAYPRVRGAIFDCAVGQVPTVVRLDRMVAERDLVPAEDDTRHRQFHREPVDQIQRARNMERIGASFDRLSKKHQEVVVRHYWDGAPLARIANDLGRSRSWASRVHSEALAELRELQLVA